MLHRMGISFNSLEYGIVRVPMGRVPTIAQVPRKISPIGGKTV